LVALIREAWPAITRSLLRDSDDEVARSAWRAAVALGEEVIGPVLRKVAASADPAVHAHASATERILRDPNTGSERAVDVAKRRFVLGKE
jgi:hypothetical protein